MLEVDESIRTCEGTKVSIPLVQIGMSRPSSDDRNARARSASLWAVGGRSLVPSQISEVHIRSDRSIANLYISQELPITRG